MREFAERKRRPLYLVGAAPRPSNDIGDYSPIFVDRSFQGWQRALAAVEKDTEDEFGVNASRSLLYDPMLQTSQESLAAEETIHVRTVQYSAPRAVTTEEFIPVMLATIRESFTHPRWPLEAVSTFLKADVILPAKPVASSQ